MDTQNEPIPSRQEILSIAGEIARDTEATRSERLQALKLLLSKNTEELEKDDDDSFFTNLAEGIAARLIERFDRAGG